MPEYKTVRPLKPSAPVILYAVCYFGDADDAACLQFGRHQLHARDKPHDQMFEEAWTRIRPRYLVCHDRFSMFFAAVSDQMSARLPN